MEIAINNEKYIIAVRAPQTQFYSLFLSRFELLSKYIIPNLEEPIFHSISEIPESVECSFVAIVNKYSKARLYSLENDSNSDSDKIYLEDKTGKIRVSSGMTPVLFITGVAVGVKGTLKNNMFQVTQIYYPIIEPITPIQTDCPIKIAIVSELHINSHEFDYPTARGFMKSLKNENVSILIVIGSTFCSVDTYSDLHDDWIIKKEIIDITPIQMLEYLFDKVDCQKIFIPGSADPTNSNWPQPPIFSNFFSGVKSVESCTNPASFSINGIKFLASSGDAIHDVMNETNYSFHESQAMLLRWRLLAPSMPSLIQPQLSMTTDRLIIDDIPNFFICGDADTFKFSDLNGVKIISVPPFWSTNTAVFIELRTGDISSKRFSKSNTECRSENVD